MKPEDILVQIQSIESNSEEILTEAKTRAKEIEERARREALEIVNRARLDIEEERRLAFEKTTKEIEEIKENLLKENNLLLERFKSLLEERKQIIVNQIKEKVIG